MSHKVIKIYNIDNYTLIRGIVLAIAYREKVKNRNIFIQQPANKLIRAAIYRAALTCNIIFRKADIGDLPNLEKYFKYNIILLDEDYLDSQKVLYSSNSIFQKNIYLQWRPPWGINIIDSIKSYCGKNLFEKPIE